MNGSNGLMRTDWSKLDKLTLSKQARHWWLITELCKRIVTGWTSRLLSEKNVECDEKDTHAAVIETCMASCFSCLTVSAGRPN
ncbi:hypothetical protein BaRGS_00002509 [Batillaria attramentaria]|uniref:Uncharacterized protein n=1 Tax=Batillaria attramentaria TaxID=370345 RepID=A0ABD0M554_9CAEN